MGRRDLSAFSRTGYHPHNNLIVCQTTIYYNEKWIGGSFRKPERFFVAPPIITILASLVTDNIYNNGIINFSVNLCSTYDANYYRMKEIRFVYYLQPEFALHIYSKWNKMINK